MKRGITIRAQTVKEAIRLALEHLGLSQEEVEIRVLEEPGAGPAGSEEALVQVIPREAVAPPGEEADPRRIGLEVLSELLRHMGIQAHVSIGEYAIEPGEARPILDVTTTNERDSGLLIGRRGETLNRLQFLVNLLVNRKLHRWPGLLVDVEHYRRRRDASLRDMARRMAERVIRTQQPLPLEPMSAYERRVVHLVLRGHPQVITQSTGEGDSRKVVIYPAGWELPPSSS